MISAIFASGLDSKCEYGALRLSQTKSASSHSHEAQMVKSKLGGGGSP